MFPTNDPSKKLFRKKLRNNPTRSEVILWSHLQKSQAGYKFRRQFGVGPFIVDFCCYPLKLVIEIDGITHEDPQVQFRDQVREKFLRKAGYTIIRFSDELVFDDPISVVDAIVIECERIINTTPTPPKRRGF